MTAQEHGETPPIVAEEAPSVPAGAGAVESSFRRSLRRATIIPVVLVAAGAVFLAAVVLWLRVAHGWVDHTDVVIGQANHLQKLTMEREDALRGYLLSHERTFLEQFNVVDLQISPMFDELQELVADNPAQVEALQSARVEVIRSRHHAALQIDRVMNGEPGMAVASHVGEGTTITRKILDGLEAFIETEQQLRPHRVRRANQLTLYALILGAGLGIGVGAAIALGTASQMQLIRRRYVDVLERQGRTERALADANSRLRDADSRKDEFLGLLSHELRNPLAPIRNSVHVLGRAEPGSDLAKRARAVIERQVEHLTRLVEDLLDIKRISAGKMLIRRERVDLVARVRELVEDMRALFALKRVLLELHAAEQVWIDADATRVTQVVGNLLQNAAKFTDPGGCVTVSITGEDAVARLRVRDTGVGIAPELLDSLFDPFVQAPQTLDRNRGGLGLGLALVRGIIELHGGSVEVHSEPGRGTEFDVTLPLAPPAPIDKDMGVSSSTATAKRRILIIEDNEDAAESLRDLIELAGGHSVSVAHDGATGVDEARRMRPDVVLCDLGLPSIDGFEVARQLRTGSDRLPATLVALSGYASPEDVERSIRAGFDYHLPKPPELDTLLKILSAGPKDEDTGSAGGPSSSPGS